MKNLILATLILAVSAPALAIDCTEVGFKSMSAMQLKHLSMTIVTAKTILGDTPEAKMAIRIV
ncbi:MAG: hypothetical protein COB27_004600 [Moritella sp.]|uniref:hypothetical protein n=1 Tax=Moritella sp. TaxID=78556 RepID=UPI00216E5AD1|nr:hypothetical protein [Moritella sp.]MBL1416140.1 hypothetical protein [Moritella sp.]